MPRDKARLCSESCFRLQRISWHLPCLPPLEFELDSRSPFQIASELLQRKLVDLRKSLRLSGCADLKSEHDLCRSEVFHFKPFAKLPLDRGDFGLAASGDRKFTDVEGDDQDAGRLVTNVEARVARTACDF